MKAIMISIRPEFLYCILHEYKTVEIRKSIPKCDLPIEVYIYCTKGKEELVYNYSYNQRKIVFEPMNGKVVAKFTLNKIEKLEYNNIQEKYFTKTLNCEDYIKSGWANAYGIKEYLKGKNGYAWHIDNLVIFDKPKELGEFMHIIGYTDFGGFVKTEYGRLTKAPQSYMFIETGE